MLEHLFCTYFIRIAGILQALFKKAYDRFRKALAILFPCIDYLSPHARLHPLETIFQSGESKSIFDLLS